jgi:Bacterial putative lipoprotein (DUF940).
MIDLRPVRSSLLAGALFFVLVHPASAELSHAGYTGLISIPTPEVEPEGRMCIAFSWLDGSRTYLMAPRINRVYALTMGLLPGLEVTFRQTQVIGWRDPDAPGVAYAFDRMGSFKYRLPLPAGFPRLAAGIQDFASVGMLMGISPLKPGLDQRGLTTLYAVMGDRLGPVAWSLGAARSHASINGTFGGASIDLPGGFQLMAEHDSQTINLGMRFSPHPAVMLQASRIGDGTQAFGGRIGWSL